MTGVHAKVPWEHCRCRLTPSEGHSQVASELGIHPEDRTKEGVSTYAGLKYEHQKQTGKSRGARLTSNADFEIKSFTKTPSPLPSLVINSPSPSSIRSSQTVAGFQGYHFTKLQ